MQRHLATASSLLISAAIREMIPQHTESSQILTTVTIPDGENINDHNGPSSQCLLRIVLGTTGDRHQLVAWRDLQGVAAKEQHGFHKPHVEISHSSSDSQPTTRGQITTPALRSKEQKAWGDPVKCRARLEKQVLGVSRTLLSTQALCWLLSYCHLDRHAGLGGKDRHPICMSFSVKKKKPSAISHVDGKKSNILAFWVLRERNAKLEKNKGGF